MAEPIALKSDKKKLSNWLTVELYFLSRQTNSFLHA